MWIRPTSKELVAYQEELVAQLRLEIHGTGVRSAARCGAGSVVSWCESAPVWRQTRLCGRSGPCKGTRAGVAHVDRSNRNGTHDPRAEGVVCLR